MDAERVGVEQAWLAAGKRGDVDEMRRLRAQHPQWLDLARVVAVPTKGSQGVDSASPRSPTTFCDWEQFYLATIGDSALHAAAWEGHAPILQYLLEEGQSPDARDDRGMSVLVVTLLRHSVQAMRAVFLGPDIVQLNTVVDCREQDAQRLAHTMEVCNLLIRHGADLNAANEDGKTALHFAANDELYDVAQLLLEAGAFADPADEDGQTPLHYSVESQSLRATAVLIARGARVDFPDRRGVSPMSLAIAKRDASTLQVMLEHFRQVSLPAGSRSFAGHVLLLAAEAGALELVQLIIQGRYAAPDECNQRGETALHLAIVKHHEEIVRFLGSQMPVGNGTGGFLAPRTVCGESVVHYAARYGTPDTMSFLLGNAGPSAVLAVNDVASPVGRPSCGHTPLFLATTATAGSPQEREGKMNLLRELGARLFGGPAHVFVGVGSSSFGSHSSVLFSWGVRRCVSQWLLESGNELLAPFCLSWAGHLGPGPLGNVAQALVHCGFASDVVPLLRECRVDVAGVGPLLNDLSVVANASGHELLRLLHAEVASAWAEITRH